MGAIKIGEQSKLQIGDLNHVFYIFYTILGKHITWFIKMVQFVGIAYNVAERWGPELVEIILHFQPILW